MAFPSLTGTQQQSLDQAWYSARTAAGQIKAQAQSLQTRLAAGSTTAGFILDFASFMASQRQVLLASSLVSGIAAYAQAQIANPSIDIPANFSAMLSAIDSVASWIVTNFPKDVNSNLLYVQFAPSNNGALTFASFTPAQTAGLQSALNALIATID